jgi:hypothetical protein
MCARVITCWAMAKHDWGIPNWLDSASYGDTTKWSWDRWHWEFTRRRDDVRRDFLAHKGEAERLLQEIHAAEIARGGSTKCKLQPDVPRLL